MKGSHEIILETRHLKYVFNIKRNITIILGDSATGKTTMMSLLQEYGLRKESSGVKLQSDVPCEVYTGNEDQWQILLQSYHNSIIFFDEGYSFIFKKEFAEFIKNTDNYYVFITRKPIKCLPYSINEIYEIRTTGKYHFPEQVYHEFYPVYADINSYYDTIDNDSPVLLVEDDKSGYQFFSKTWSGNCISTKGNAGFSKMLRTYKPSAMIADGAAFGAYIQDVIIYKEHSPEVMVYLPESFEWMILKSGVINSNIINDILDHPEDYIESSVHFSWERFFTDYLSDITKDDTITAYQKDSLKQYYLDGKVKNSILSVIPEKLRCLFD